MSYLFTAALAGLQCGNAFWHPTPINVGVAVFIILLVLDMRSDR